MGRVVGAGLWRGIGPVILSIGLCYLLPIAANAVWFAALWATA